MENSTYSTPDFWIATSLVASDIPIIGTTNNNGKLEWTFEETPEQMKVVKGFFNGNLTLNVQKIRSAQQILKNQFKQYNPR